jgi:ABC-2 type transport system ATP-binding protein
MVDFVIETRNLTKRYGAFKAVDSLDLSVKRGEVYGLLGPNGSGKTTTILMLLGLTEPTEGTIRVLDLDPARQPLSVKARVGYLPDEVGFYGNLTARENLIYIAKLNSMPRSEAYQRIAEALERMGLSEVGDKRVGEFSRGMRQRLGAAELLIKQPEIIIMDEPTLGLDPEAARRFLKIIEELSDEGKTILLTSHLLHQVQAVCDRVGLFRQGRLALEGTVNELARQVLGGAYHVLVAVEEPSEGFETTFEGLPGVVNVQRPLDGHYVLETTADLRAEVANVVVGSGGRLKMLDIEHPNLDDIYGGYFEEAEHAVTA